jgi:hypothetical protein
LKNDLLCLPGKDRLMGDRTSLDATAAPCAAVHVNASSALLDFYFKIPRGPFHRFQIRIGDEFNVQMPADLDQFGRDDSHGAVVGGEGLVQLGHGPPDRWALF